MFKRSFIHLLRTALADPSACLLAYVAIRRYYAVQRLWELTQLVARVQKLRPVTVFEIGTHMGGTLYCWSRILPKGSVLVSLDLPADPNEPRTTAPVLEKIVESMPPKTAFIRDDSHLPATREKVLAALEGRPVDFLFIDGARTYEGVKQDFERYSPLVKSGGLVAFHDIAPNPEVPDYGVAKFWQELRNARPGSTSELIDPHPVGPAGMGIGLVRMGK